MAELGEKTEQPTVRKLLEARNRGQVPKSQDLSAAVGLFVAAIALIITGSMIGERLYDLTLRSLDARSLGGRLSMDAVGEQVRTAAADGAAALLPVMGIMTLGLIVANFMQVGPLLTFRPIEPKLTKLSPIAGVKRIYGIKGLVKTLVNIFKLAGIILVVAIVIIRREAEMVSLSILAPMQAVMVTGSVLVEVLAWMIFLLVVIGILDYMFQRWQHRQELKMTKQEVKDELKSMEGDPELKRRRMQIAQGIAFQRVAQDVPEADVVVTNPTHFSVAIRYDQGWRAPKVSAKGADHMAFRIRQIAVHAGVPIVERPPLARALYWGTEPGDEISPEHYEAVAEVLAYVYRLDGEAGPKIRADQSRRPAREAVTT